jgi:ATP-dependent DNA helicase RecG
LEDLEIPEDSLREAIFNAIIHKDYAGVHIQMKVWDDRIEIWNDGGLPYDMSIEKLLGQHSSKPRNVNIASVFYKAGFIESWGRGILKIQKGFEDAGIKAPQFEEDCGGVRVTMYRNIKTTIKEKNQGETKEKNQGETKEKIIELIRNNPYITQKEMRELLGLSQGGIEYQIRNLKQDGVIKRVGGDRGGHWEIL